MFICLFERFYLFETQREKEREQEQGGGQRESRLPTKQDPEIVT